MKPSILSLLSLLSTTCLLVFPSASVIAENHSFRRMPAGWTAESPREEIAPDFEYNLKEARMVRGVFVSPPTIVQVLLAGLKRHMRLKVAKTISFLQFNVLAI